MEVGSVCKIEPTAYRSDPAQNAIDPTETIILFAMTH